LGAFAGLSSLWELVEGLAGVDDGQNQRRMRKRLAEWQNLSHGLPDLSHDHDGLSHRYFQSVEDSFELGRLKQ